MRVLRWVAGKGLVLMFGLVLAGSAVAAVTEPMRDRSSPPDGLSATDWTQITAQIHERQYAARPGADGSFVAANPEHGWGIAHRADGQTVLVPSATDRAQPSTDYRIALRVQSLGYGDMRVALGRPTDLGADQGTVTYRWGNGLREWWINSAQGVEQWFELAAPPQRSGGQSAAAPLTLAMELDTGLDATIQNNALQLRSADGNTRIRYAGLKAWDADGVVLAATMRLQGEQLALQIDDRDARYPITIDPNFAQQAYLKASNPGAFQHFGQSVSVSGDTVVVGMPAGSADVFVRNGGIWSLQASLKASNADAGDQFGWSVAVSGDTVVVGAPFEDGNATGVNGDQGDNSAANSGAAYVFVRSGGGWSQQAYLKAAHTDADDRFGYSVATSGNTVIVGSRFEDSNSAGINGNPTDNSASNAGAAYVFVRSGLAWTQQAYLKASNADFGDQFGFSVAVSDDAAVVGAPDEDSIATGVNGDQVSNSTPKSGAAYVFVRSGTSWSQQAYLKASNTHNFGSFGRSVAVSGDIVVVGEPNEAGGATGVNGDQTDLSVSAAGAAYVFVRSGASWGQQAYLKASNTGADDNFGFAVAVSSDTVVVGAIGEASSATGVDGDQGNDPSADFAGAAYVFVRQGGSWSQLSYLKAASVDYFDQFGTSVAVSNDTVVVGMPFEASNAAGIDGDPANNSISDAGAAYVFALSDTAPPPNNLPIGSVTITGDVTEDQTLVAENTLADADGLGALNYVWLLDGVAVPGATSDRFVPDDLSVGKMVRVKVSYIDGRGFPESVSSAVVGPVRAEGSALPLQKRVFFFNPASNLNQQSFLRVINRNAQAVDLELRGIDDDGQPAPLGAVTFTLGANRSLQVTSQDLELGNPGKGLSGRFGTGMGKWQIKVGSSLPIDVMSLIRTPDGFVTNLSDTAPQWSGAYRVYFANPASNSNQQTFIRVVNRSSQSGPVTVSGVDDLGVPGPGGNLNFVLGPHQALQFNSTDYELGNSGKGLQGALGAGTGKWRLALESALHLEVMSLIRTPDGFLTSLSATAPNDPKTLNTSKLLMTVNSADETRQQAFIRVINPMSFQHSVIFSPRDDNGLLPPRFSVSMNLEARGSQQFTAADLENGNADKGLINGFGSGTGRWHMEVWSGIIVFPLTVQNLVRTPDGFVTNLSELAPKPSPFVNEVPMLNPGDNANQRSFLRLINRSNVAGSAIIAGVDDAGLPAAGGNVVVDLAPHAVIELTAQDIELGNAGSGQLGAFGKGSGKWRLTIESDVDVEAQALLETPNGFITTTSAPVREPVR